MNRRNFLATSVLGANSIRFLWFDQTIDHSTRQHAYSVIPVVADGKWIWRDPPDKTGYLEPREFAVTVGISATGTGDTRNLTAATVSPVKFPEQKILDFKIENSGCESRVVQLVDGAAQLVLQADNLGRNQTVSTLAFYRLQLSKTYLGFEKEQFPLEQDRIRQCPKRYLRSSPGIKIGSPEVKGVIEKVVSADMHPWDKTRKLYQWIWENISAVEGQYSSVEAAIRNRRGDCEERACTLIALCRRAGIPARQVWVPNHVWAEIALHDFDGNWFWIPIHTAAYSWFGWTGVHEVVLQKGDRVSTVMRNGHLRMVDDWYRATGARPKIEFTCEITPIPASEGADPGPGGRRKLADGRWILTGTAASRKFTRDR